MRTSIELSELFTDMVGETLSSIEHTANRPLRFIKEVIQVPFLEHKVNLHLGEAETEIKVKKLLNNNFHIVTIFKEEEDIDQKVEELYQQKEEGAQVILSGLEVEKEQQKELEK